MSDYYSEPNIEATPEPLPMPAEHSESAGMDDAVRQVKDEIFDRIANSDDDATDYVEETKDREAEERGEKLSPEREKKRLERYQKALSAADQDLASVVDEGVNQHDQLDSDLARRDAAVIRDTKHHMRVEAFQREHPDYQDTVKGVFGALPVQDHVAEALIESNISAKLAYDIAHRLAQHPDPVAAVNAINSMSPEQLRLDIARIEGAHEALQANQRNSPPARRATRAPAPLKSIRGGGASPAFDPETATMDEYAAWRNRGGGN